MVHDYFTTEKIGRFSFPTIKGHVKIALKDIRTGKTDIAFEGDNIITDAVKDIFASNLNGSMDYRSMLPLYSKMLGGILCFKELLNVDTPTVADAKKDYYIPDAATNELTAHAGQTRFTSQADDVKRGDPLNTSVVVADGSVTLAWEWGSAAGNGKIKSVALTHADVGDAGLGSGSDAFKAMIPNINSNLGFTANQAAWFIDSNGYGYSISYSGSTLSLTRYPMAYKEVGLIGMPFDYIAGKASTKNITIGTTYSSFPSFYFDKATNKLHLWYNTSSSTSVKYDVVNISNWNSISTTHEDWTLDTAVGYLSHDRGPIVVPVYNGYVYLPKMNERAISGYVKVNITNTADESELNGTTYNSGVFIPDVSGRILAGKDFVINNGVLYPCTKGEPDALNEFNLSNQWYHSTLDQGIGLVQSVYKRNGTSAATFYDSISKFYLASKFNLPEEVTKSNVQSMVITYTLTEV